MKEKITGFLFILLIGWLLFFFGGWHLSLSKKMDDVGKIYAQNIENIGQDDVELEDLECLVDISEKPKAIINEYGILIRMGKSYVGFISDSRFFGVPVLQWIMLIASLLVIYGAFYTLFGDDDEQDSKDQPSSIDNKTN